MKGGSETHTTQPPRARHTTQPPRTTARKPPRTPRTTHPEIPPRKPPRARLPRLVARFGSLRSPAVLTSSGFVERAAPFIPALSVVRAGGSGRPDGPAVQVGRTGRRPVREVSHTPPQPIYSFAPVGAYSQIPRTIWLVAACGPSLRSDPAGGTLTAPFGCRSLPRFSLASLAPNRAHEPARATWLVEVGGGRCQGEAK